MPSTGPVILVLDHNSRNLELLDQFLRKQNYEPVCIGDLGELQQFIADTNALSTISMALLDITGFDSGLWESAEILREHKIPFFIISAGKNPATQETGLNHGASRVLVKPLVGKELIQIISAIVKGK
ncbi:MAG TPA: response regulator [Candidatus Lokiarchaeia archaeon]|nr:response regulator [Candidatus Lokiarchaeia archaeon]